MKSSSVLSIITIITIILYLYDFFGSDEDPIEEEDNEAERNTFECNQQVLSCVKIATRLIKELKLDDLEIQPFQNLQEKYSYLRNDGELISRIECQEDLSTCKTSTIKNIADALEIALSFNCTSIHNETGHQKHHCDEWDFFDIYLHCDANGSQQLLVDEQLWKEGECKLGKSRNDNCDTKCTWKHEWKMRNKNSKTII